MSHMGFSDACGSSSTNVDALFDEKGEHDLGDFTVTKINDTENPLYLKVIEILAQSECGSSTTAPDPLLDWCYSPRTDDVFLPLSESPSSERIAWFRWLMEYLALFAINRKSLYALKDKESQKVVSAAIVGPPRTVAFDRSYSEMGVNLRKAGMTLAIDILSENRRIKSLGAWQHKHLPGDGFGNFLYIHVFATAPEEQGRGCGTALIQFLGTLADVDGVDTYLETAGSRNTSFYEKKGGFLEMAREKLGNFTYEGGAVSMQRLPKQENNRATKDLDHVINHLEESLANKSTPHCISFTPKNRSGPLKFFCTHCNEHRSTHGQQSFDNRT